MLPSGTVWWTDDRVKEIVNSAYIHSHLRPDEQELLRRPLFGDELTDGTYLDWILTKARRFFLVLVATGVPDQIFGILDDSYADDDLPIAESTVAELRLSLEPDALLDKRFYKNQFRFLTRVVGDGEHVPYADEEIVPVQVIGLKPMVNIAKDGIDKVKIFTNSQVFVRRKISLNSETSESNILVEIANAKRYAHQHCLSVFGSYTHQGVFNILSYPAAEYSLKSFLTDTPKAFENLDKSVRRQMLLNWPHCLANALCWLHANQQPHGSIRPSNIIVDSSFNIAFGALEGDGALDITSKPDDVETYQYGPPERWKRAVTVQSRTMTASLPSGGRSMGKGSSRPPTRLDGRKSIAEAHAGSKAYQYQSTSKSTFAKLRLSASIDATLIPRPKSKSELTEDTGDSQSVLSQPTIRHHNRPRPSSPLSTITSAVSSGGSSGTKSSARPVFVAGPESRAAVVQTWRSVEHDVFASDVFSLGAVIMDILSVLCKKTCGAFARHRSAKNRNAGRGGGLADASFHANLGQIVTWAQLLQTESEKKSKKEVGQSLSVVGPFLQITMQCLERSPEKRPTSQNLAKKLEEYLLSFAHISSTHCQLQCLTSPITPESPRRARSRGRALPPVQGRQAGTDKHRDYRGHMDRKISEAVPETMVNSNDQRDPFGVPIKPGQSYESILRSQYQGSDERVSVLASGMQSPVSSVPPRYNDVDSMSASTVSLAQPQPIGAPIQLHTKRRWDTWHNNESAVDPRISIVESMEPGGGSGYTYLSTSASTSHSSNVSDSEGGILIRPMPSPLAPNPPPDRELPPLPYAYPMSKRSSPGTRSAGSQPSTISPQSQSLAFSQIKPQTSQTFDLEALKQMSISPSHSSASVSGSTTMARPPVTPKDQITNWPIPPPLDEEQTKIIRARSRSRSRPVTPRSSNRQVDRSGGVYV